MWIHSDQKKIQLLLLSLDPLPILVIESLQDSTEPRPPSPGLARRGARSRWTWSWSTITITSTAMGLTRRARTRPRDRPRPRTGAAAQTRTGGIGGGHKGMVVVRSQVNWPQCNVLQRCNKPCHKAGIAELAKCHANSPASSCPFPLKIGELVDFAGTLKTAKFEETGMSKSKGIPEFVKLTLILEMLLL